jgi:hypothetical protein
LRSILEKDKLNGTNYVDWIRNLRIVLKVEKKEEILDTPLPNEPADNAPAAEKTTYKRACDADLEVSCLILACMEPDLQMQFDNNHAAYDMIVALSSWATCDQNGWLHSEVGEARLPNWPRVGY